MELLSVRTPIQYLWFGEKAEIVGVERLIFANPRTLPLIDVRPYVGGEPPRATGWEGHLPHSPCDHCSRRGVVPKSATADSVREMRGGVSPTHVVVAT